MKFDHFAFSEVAPGVRRPIGAGVLRVRCSAASPLYIETEGVEVLAGVDTSFEVDLSRPVIWHVDAAAPVRVFVFEPVSTTAECRGEVFTNIDRLPSESGTLYEVQRAMRELEFQRRRAMREIRMCAAAHMPVPARSHPVPPLASASDHEGNPDAE